MPLPSFIRAVPGLALKALLQLPTGRPITIEGSTLAREIQSLLKLLAIANIRQPGLPLNPASHRKLTDDSAILLGGVQSIGRTRDLTVSGAAGPIPARLYIPSSALAAAVDDTPAAAPLLVFYHGGGFTIGSLASHDPTCRFLAEQSGVRVLAVDYRLAPEHPFPAAVDDAIAAFEWAHRHAAELGADPARIAVGGDSAGGNLAAIVALHAKEKVRFQLLIYPATATQRGPSGQTFAEGFFLTRDLLQQFIAAYLSATADRNDPRISPMLASIPPDAASRLAPAYLATAAFDPLRDEGEAYAEKLRAAGVKAQTRRYPALIHGFVNFIGVSRTAKAATLEIARALATGLRPG
jgi:acetyl esterase